MSISSSRNLPDGLLSSCSEGPSLNSVPSIHIMGELFSPPTGNPEPSVDSHPQLSHCRAEHRARQTGPGRKGGYLGTTISNKVLDRALLCGYNRVPRATEVRHCAHMLSPALQATASLCFTTQRARTDIPILLRRKLSVNLDRQLLHFGIVSSRAGIHTQVSFL